MADGLFRVYLIVIPLYRHGVDLLPRTKKIVDTSFVTRLLFRRPSTVQRLSSANPQHVVLLTSTFPTFLLHLP